MLEEVMDKILTKFKKAKTDDERRQIIESGRSILTSEEMEEVRGGLTPFSAKVMGC